MTQNNSIFSWILFIYLLIFASVLVIVYFNRENIIKASKDSENYETSDVNGTVESVHPWGRKEVVSITSVSLIHLPNIDEWVLSGENVQPRDRTGYFVPVLSGKLDNKYKTAQLTEHSTYETGPDKDAKKWISITYHDFRFANIIFKDNKPKSILYYHYRFQKDSWITIASWEANF